MKIIVVDNFFNNFSNIEKAFKKIPLYDLNKYNKKFNITENWPGLRSENLFNQNPFLFNLILHEFFTKFKIPFSKNGIKMKSHVHLRLNNSIEDWIHTDSHDPNGNYLFDKTLMIYLSETNLKSGTCFYENNSDIPSSTINFVQNRAVLFDADIRHKSLNNYGININNGRLTLNCFLNKGYEL